MSKRHLSRTVPALALAGVLVVLTATPAAADNCNLGINPLDCQNMAWSVGVVSTIAAAASAFVAASGHSSARFRDRWAAVTRFDDVPADKTTCADVVRWLDQQTGHPGRVDTTLRPREGEGVRRNLPGGRVRLEMPIIGWSIDMTASSMRLPQWRTPNTVEQAAWNSFLAALRHHELVHAQLAERYARQIEGTRIVVEGFDEADARKNYREELLRLIEHHENQIGALHERYDEATSHGRNQSAANAGRDVRLVCPP